MKKQLIHLHAQKKGVLNKGEVGEWLIRQLADAKLTIRSKKYQNR